MHTYTHARTHACIHRHALIEGFEVRRAEEADAEGVSMLVSGMPNSAHVQDLFRNAQARGTAVVASVQVCVRVRV
eukprot:scaffold113047_cov21-Tisochrysis_lutea.AAC.1